MNNGQDSLRIEYKPLAWVIDHLWERNPKIHDIAKITRSIQRYGMRDAGVWDETLNRVVAGNGRSEALAQMRAQGLPPPRGVRVESGDWLIPLQFGLDAPTPEEAESFGIDHNNLTMGSEFDTTDLAKMWQLDRYVAVLSSLTDAPLTVDEQDLGVLTRRLERSNKPIDESSTAIGGNNSPIQFNSEVFFPSTNKLGIPDLKPELLLEIPDDIAVWAGPDGKSEPAEYYLWNYNNSTIGNLDRSKALVGFYVFDDVFQNIWYYPERITTRLLNEGWMGAVQINYSFLTGDPLVFMQWNTYRARWMCRFWQEFGIKVVPEVNFGDAETFEFNLLGVPYSPPSLFVQAQNRADAESVEMESDGILTICQRLAPKKLGVYGATPARMETIQRIVPDTVKVIFVRSVNRQLKRWFTETRKREKPKIKEGR